MGWMVRIRHYASQAVNNKLRPVAYDATIVLALGLRHVTYAGLPWHRHCYQVH